MDNTVKHQVLKIRNLPLFIQENTRSVVFVLEGKCTVKRFSLIKEFKEGDVFFINPHEVVSVISKQGCIVEWIEFDVNVLNNEYNSLFYLLNLTDSVGSMDQQKDMAEIYRDCVFTKNLLSLENGVDKELCFQEISEALITDYHEFGPYMSKEQMEWILTIHERILNNLNEKVSLQSLAELLGIKKSNLATQYKQLTGMTLLEWVNMQRLKKAEELLLFSNKSHQEIIKECGFSDSKYFYRYFMEQFNMTPSAWKEAMKQEETKIVEILGVKEKFVVLTNMMHQLSGLKTDTDLYRTSRWVQQLRNANLLNEDIIIEVDLLHADNFIEVVDQRIHAWYGFDLLLNELRKSMFTIELRFDLVGNMADELDEIVELLKKSFLHCSTKVLKCCKFVIVFHTLEELSFARSFKKRLLKEFKLDVVVKGV